MMNKPTEPGSQDAGSASDPANSSVFRWYSDTAQQFEREGRIRAAQSMRDHRWAVLESSRAYDRRQSTELRDSN